MLLKILMSLLLLLSLMSCSASRTTDRVSTTEGIELLDTDEDLLEIDERAVLESDSGVVLDKEPQSNIDTVALENIANEEVQFVETQPASGEVKFTDVYREGEEYNKGVMVGASNYNDESHYRTGGETGIYTVKKNETLMLIAFKLYGDYSRWRELAGLNSSRLGNGHKVYAGTKIRYYKEGAGFRLNANGEPYLIKQRDTLSKISNKVYGTFNRWKSIWHNNRPLIKDPNKIYAGFTIYYPLDGSNNN